MQRDSSEALEPGGKLGFSRAINWKSGARNQFRGSVKAVRASGVTADVVLDEHVRVSARNRLTGVVTAVISGGVNSEAKIQLAGGRVLTAISHARHWRNSTWLRGLRAAHSSSHPMF